MFVPIVLTRIEEWDDQSRGRIDARKIRPALSVAAGARHGKIRELVRAAMLPWNNVVNMKGHEGQRFLWEPTVFAAVPRALPNQFAQGSIHQDKLCRARAERALA